MILQAAIDQQNNWRPFEQITDEYVLHEIVELRNSSFAVPFGTAFVGKLAVPCFPDGSVLPTAEAGAVACTARWDLGFGINLDVTFMKHMPDDQPIENPEFNPGYLIFPGKQDWQQRICADDQLRTRRYDDLVYS
ncbi:hypothetical protein [Mycobacterium uberis]|uniref:hypothetical protein n=1 Tax=Mycobacterium uberis TaxID=2162698 RepID=UPI000E309078|nr:hypothetical protein [Mycobacterium uberis]